MKALQPTLFHGGFKRKTPLTSEEDRSGAEAARKEQEALDATAISKKAAEKNAASMSGVSKLPSRKPSQSAAAVKKRNQRARKPKKTKREKSAADAEKPRANAPSDFETETHYLDSKGRKRKRKKLLSVSDPAGHKGKAGNRVFIASEKQIIISMYDRMESRCLGDVSYASVARELRQQHESIFGDGAFGMPPGGIDRQTVRSIVKRREKDGGSDGRGRPPALPEAIILLIIATLTTIVSTRATLFSASMLQPVALGVIAAKGYAHLLHEGRQKRGQSRFCCSLKWMQALMTKEGWRNVRPQGNTLKLPFNWKSLQWMMVLRLAYFVLVHVIPEALVINADHTGIMFRLSLQVGTSTGSWILSGATPRTSWS